MSRIQDEIEQALITLGCHSPSWVGSIDDLRRLCVVVTDPLIQDIKSQNRGIKHCGDCNSKRLGDTCWKCGAETFEPAAEWLYPQQPDIRAYQAFARTQGYTIAVHGSLERDIDLIAVPWNENAVSCQIFIDAFCAHTKGVIVGTTEDKPHGRRAYSIDIPGWYQLIDLSVTPVL